MIVWVGHHLGGPMESWDSWRHPLQPYTDTSRAARGGGRSFKNRKPIGKIRCCESRNVFVGGNGKTATAVKNLDAITECEAHDYCFANCFQTCQEGPFSVDFTVDFTVC